MGGDVIDWSGVDAASDDNPIIERWGEIQQFEPESKLLTIAVASLLSEQIQEAFLRITAAEPESFAAQWNAEVRGLAELFVRNYHKAISLYGIAPEIVRQVVEVVVGDAIVATLHKVMYDKDK